MKRRLFMKSLLSGSVAAAIPACRKTKPEVNRSPVQVANAWSLPNWDQNGWDKLFTEERIIDSDPNDPDNWKFIQEPGEALVSEGLEQVFQDRLNQFTSSSMNKIRTAKLNPFGIVTEGEL